MKFPCLWEGCPRPAAPDHPKYCAGHSWEERRQADRRAVLDLLARKHRIRLEQIEAELRAMS